MWIAGACGQFLPLIVVSGLHDYVGSSLKDDEKLQTCELQEPVVNAWPSLSPVGSMTMLGSSLKDDEILPGSPVTKLTDLIPSYLPSSEQQASAPPRCFCFISYGVNALLWASRSHDGGQNHHTCWMFCCRLRSLLKWPFQRMPKICMVSTWLLAPVLKFKASYASSALACLMSILDCFSKTPPSARPAGDR